MTTESEYSQINITPPIIETQEFCYYLEAIQREDRPIAHLGISLALVGSIMASILGFVSAMRLKEAVLTELKGKLYNGEITHSEFTKRVKELNVL